MVSNSNSDFIYEKSCFYFVILRFFIITFTRTTKSTIRKVTLFMEIVDKCIGKLVIDNFSFYGSF